MTEHRMHLSAAPFEGIAKAQKTVEARLFDTKRQGIHPGDTIIFQHQNFPNKQLSVQVTALHPYPTFRELYEALGAAKFGGSNVDELISLISSFYTHAQEEQYGAVGIEFKLIEQ